MTTTTYAEPAVVPRSTSRVLDLLEAVLAAQQCTLTEAAAKAGLTPTTALRHLRALEARGYLDRDGVGRFSAGPTLLRIAAGLQQTTAVDRLISSAQHHLDSLAIETGESAYLAVSDGRTATYVATAESARAIRHVGWVGQNVTLKGTAVGEALAVPGRVVVRSGAVEPDITAMALGMAKIDGLDVAISIIGPEHRFTEEARSHIEAVLTSEVAVLVAGAGVDHHPRTSEETT